MPLIPALFSILLSLPAAGTPPQLVPVQVRIRTDGGEPVRDVYVALVPGWRPAHAPLVEEILHEARGEFRVAEDTYRVIVAARGYHVLTQGPLTFAAAGGAGKVEVTLEPLAQASGLVTDAEGNPLAGVRVEDTRAAVEAPFGGLSEMAARLLSPDWSTVTGRRGNWSLRLPRGSVPIVFSAAGRAAQFRIWKSNDAQPLDVAMPAGGALQVHADRADANVVITIERDGATPAGSIPKDWQRQLWARWAGATTLSWHSLPPGSYAILAKYFEPAYFMQRAVKIGLVSIAAGGAAKVTVKLPPPSRPAARVVRWFVEGAAADRISADELEAYGADERGAPQRVPALLQTTTGGAVIHVNADHAAGPFFAATTTQFFSAGAPSDDPATPVPIAAARDRADAHADVRSAEQDLQLPRGGTAVLRDCASVRKGQSTTVSVPMDLRNGHTARFIAPANCGSAVLSFAPFEPIVLPKPLHRGEQSLGEFALRAAASADIHVVTSDGAAVPGAVVRVMTHEPDIPLLVTEATTSADGWARIAAIPVQRNVRIAAQSADGDASDVREVRAEPREKVVVDALRIASAASVVIGAKMKPSVRARFPASRVRMILLQPREAQPGDSQRSERVRDEAPVRFEHLRPGVWKVGAVISVAGTDTFLPLDEIELEPGESRRIEKEVEPLVFTGRVTIGGEGVAARITLENSAAVAPVNHFDSHADGGFYAIVPSRGRYRVAVARLDAQQAVIPAGELDFDDPSRPVEIALPAMASVVVHVRKSGEAVRNAPVSTVLQSAPLQQVLSSDQSAQTDAKGDARFDQLLPGQWVFAVRENESGGGETSLGVREGERAETTIELDRTTIGGTVRNAAGQPVSQARIACYPIGPSNLPARVQAETSAAGRFTIQLAAKPMTPVSCSVVTAAGEVEAFTASPESPAAVPVVVQLPAATARLQINDWGKQYNPEAFWLVAADGRVISLSAVADMLRGPGPALLIPALAAGRWKVVRLDSVPQWLALLGRQGAALPGAEVSLQAGASETVSIYEANRP